MTDGRQEIHQYLITYLNDGLLTRQERYFFS
jgi:hypothetical protein